MNRLRSRVKTLQETNEILRNRNVDLLAKADGLGTIANGSTGEGRQGYCSVTCGNLGGGDAVQGLMRKYLEEVETLRSSLYESQATSDQLRREMQKWKAQVSWGRERDGPSYRHWQMASPFRPQLSAPTARPSHRCRSTRNSSSRRPGRTLRG